MGLLRAKKRQKISDETVQEAGPAKPAVPQLAEQALADQRIEEAAPAKAGHPERTEFFIMLDKTAGESLGVGVDKVHDLGGTRLRIDEVHEEGLVASWNHTNTDRAVKEGDYLLAVNGRIGYEGMAAELRKHRLLKIKLTRIVWLQSDRPLLPASHPADEKMPARTRNGRLQKLHSIDPDEYESCGEDAESCYEQSSEDCCVTVSDEGEFWTYAISDEASAASDEGVGTGARAKAKTKAHSTARARLQQDRPQAWLAFKCSEWDFSREVQLKDQGSELGIEYWCELATTSSLNNAYVKSVQVSSQAAMLGISVPSIVLRINDQPIRGMERSTFKSLMKSGRHCFTFGLGKPTDTMKAVNFIRTWGALNPELRLPAGEPSKFVAVSEFAEAGLYYVCQPKVADSRRLYVLGLEFLYDHICLAMDSPEKRLRFQSTIVQDWAQAAAVWPTEREVHTRVAAARDDRNSGNFILQCIHRLPDSKGPGEPAYELVGACQFFPEGGVQPYCLYMSKLKVLRLHQRRGVAQLLFRSFLSQVKDKLLHSRPHLFGKLTKTGLEVFADNRVAIDLYQKLGYRITREQPLRGIEAAMICRMEKLLPWTQESDLSSEAAILKAQLVGGEATAEAIEADVGSSSGDVAQQT